MARPWCDTPTPYCDMRERERERERWQWWAQGVTIIIRIIKKTQ